MLESSFIGAMNFIPDSLFRFLCVTDGYSFHNEPLKVHYKSDQEYSLYISALCIVINCIDIYISRLISMLTDCGSCDCVTSPTPFIVPTTTLYTGITG